jgi:hypothetical protein
LDDHGLVDFVALAPASTFASASGLGSSSAADSNASLVGPVPWFDPDDSETGPYSQRYQGHPSGRHIKRSSTVDSDATVKDFPQINRTSACRTLKEGSDPDEDEDLSDAGVTTKRKRNEEAEEEPSTKKGEN